MLLSAQYSNLRRQLTLLAADAHRSWVTEVERTSGIGIGEPQNSVYHVQPRKGSKPTIAKKHRLPMTPYANRIDSFHVEATISPPSSHPRIYAKVPLPPTQAQSSPLNTAQYGVTGLNHSEYHYFKLLKNSPWGDPEGSDR